MPLLVITAVDSERDAISKVAGSHDARIVAGGVGRTNAAAATTEAILRYGPFDAVLNAGVAGALPTGAGLLELGEVVVASQCVYSEEGMAGPEGIVDVAAIGLTLGDFPGNRVPVDERLLDLLGGLFRHGPIATVATCSGTAGAADDVARRTGAIAEAMEGAAVVHAARRLGTPAIELRAISNTTGARESQRWDLRGGLAALGPAVDRALAAMAAAR